MARGKEESVKDAGALMVENPFFAYESHLSLLSPVRQ
jgi:hypothetical protein